MNILKPDDKKQSPSFFKELGEYMKPYRLHYAGSIAISILSVSSQLGAYAFAGLAAAALFFGQNGRLLSFAAMVVICKLLATLMLNLSTWLSHRAAYRTLRDIRTAVTDKMMRLPMGFFESNGSGRLKTTLVDRIESMEATLAHMLPELTANLLVPLALLIWMFCIHWGAALCFLIWIILGFSVTGGMMKNYEEKFAGQIRAFKSMNQAVVEFVSGIEVIKNFGQADNSYKKYQKAVTHHADYNIGWQKETLSYSALGMSIAPFTIFPVLIAGILLFRSGSLGGDQLFLMILLCFGVFGPLMNTMNYYDQMAQMGTNAAEIKNILDYPELKRGNRIASPNTDIDFTNVCFSYGENEKLAADHVSFHIPQGTVLALVGPSGSGKSTIAKLLAGYWDPSEGEIRVGDHLLTDYSQEEINRMIAYVDQETYLFDGTILDNIRMAKPNAADTEVMAAARTAGCEEFILALPQGYNTEAGSAGGRLSGGERQRIAIARAMMKDAPILILDEATASSDPENEAAIQLALSAAARGRTLVVVAHRLRTIRSAEQIAFVKNGKIQIIGTHEELMVKCPAYAEAWDMSEEGII